MTSPMTQSLENLMYGFSQLFLIPVLLINLLLFLYAFYALGAFLWQAIQRRRHQAGAFELQALQQASPSLSLAELEAEAVVRLEFVKIVSRIAPMLGLVATMIPMGPALKSLGEGQLSDVSTSLMVAFSAVILALLTAAITYAIANVRRRWYAQELMGIEKSIAKGEGAA